MASNSDSTALVLIYFVFHNLQIVPYLICLSTDSDIMVCHTADNQLQDINKKYLGFIHMKANDGITLSYKLQSIIQHNSDQIIRGYR